MPSRPGHPSPQADAALQPRRATLREAAHRRADALLAPFARRLAAVGITANHLTVAGAVLALPAAVLAAQGCFVAAGLAFLFASLLDLFDGALARAAAQVSRFGAFLDSVLDRVGEALLLSGLAWRFAAAGDPLLVLAAFAALTGGLLTSYARARAEGLGLECNAGWLTRPERVLLLGIGLLAGRPGGAVLLLAALSLWTAGQRVLAVRRALSR